jgi:hypothetical protein
MRSSGFGLGKRQARNEQPKRVHPPNTEDLMQLLGSSQKSPDKLFTFGWQSESDKNCQFTLSCFNSTAQKDRRGWTSSAKDKGIQGDAEWKLTKEIDNKHYEIFCMETTDAMLIQTLIDESLGGGGNKLFGDSAQSPQMAVEEPVQQRTGAVSRVAPPQTNAPVEGNLRKTGIRGLIEQFRDNQTTGRLLCDQGGTVQVEVFFTKGEPVHAKSCYSFYADKDAVGDVVLVDLLTWLEGTFKFQEGWPAASKTITNPLQNFLDGNVTLPDSSQAASASEFAAPDPAAAPVSAPAPGPASAPPPSPPPSITTTPVPNLNFTSTRAGEFSDDFSNIEAVIGETYPDLIDGAGYLKFGLFLMLARGEFVRFESGRIPFCVASIGLELPGKTITNEILRKVSECFESVCQPLDLVACASPSRLFALIPQSNSVLAGSTLKYFINNVLTTELDGENHGNNMKISIGLAEVPKDGTEFQQVFERSCKLRRECTPEKKLVTSPS